MSKYNMEKAYIIATVNLRRDGQTETLFKCFSRFSKSVYWTDDSFNPDIIHYMTVDDARLMMDREQFNACVVEKFIK